MRAKVASFETPAVGEIVPIAFDPGRAHWFDRASGKVLAESDE